MNRFLRQGFHSHGPDQAWLLLDQSLQITDLVSQAQLPVLSRRRQLSPKTIADPTLGPFGAHKFPDDLRPTATVNDVSDASHATEDPMPIVPRLDTHARFVTADHFALSDLRRDLCCYRLRRPATAPQDRDHSSFAQFDSVQLTHHFDNPLDAQMLLLLVIDDGRLQTRAEHPQRFQTRWRRASLQSSAVRAFDLVSLCLDHNWARRRQFSNLMTNDSSRRRLTRLGVAIGASLNFRFDDSIRVLDQRASRTLVTGFSPDLLARFLLPLIRFLVARRRLRRVARGRRRLLQFGEFRFESGETRFQFTIFIEQRFDQHDEFFTCQVLQLLMVNRRFTHRSPSREKNVPLIRDRFIASRSDTTPYGTRKHLVTRFCGSDLKVVSNYPFFPLPFSSPCDYFIDILSI